jgi:hypothetical protein
MTENLSWLKMLLRTGLMAALAGLIIAPVPNKKKAEKKIQVCITMTESPGGGVQLINKCKVCKAALIERQNKSGANGKRQAYMVNPKTPVPVPSNGAAQVALLAEVDCP